MSEQPLSIPAPGSKSLTQRALVLSALAAGESVLEGALESDDTRHLRAALRELGARVDELPDGRWRVTAGELRAPGKTLWCGDGGTVVRFLAPVALLLDDELVLDGSERLSERPITALLDALLQLGARVRSVSPPRALPVGIRAGAFPKPGTPVTVDASVSSQFVSGLLMIAPLLPDGLDLRIEGGVSRPYVEMTLAAMRSRGADFVDEVTRCVVKPGAYRAGPFPIEGDWSAAAFLLAAGFVAGREVVVPNVSADSLQGDKAIAGFLAELRRPRAHVFESVDVPGPRPAAGRGRRVCLAPLAHRRRRACAAQGERSPGDAGQGFRARGRADRGEARRAGDRPGDGAEACATRAARRPPHGHGLRVAVAAGAGDPDAGSAVRLQVVPRVLGGAAALPLTGRPRAPTTARAASVSARASFCPVQ
ncbi:MAG: hypothetical protein QM765_36725 [Myxococcales bacterium]